jgi:hypothetical protein
MSVSRGRSDGKQINTCTRGNIREASPTKNTSNPESFEVTLSIFSRCCYKNRLQTTLIEGNNMEIDKIRFRAFHTSSLTYL